MSDLLERTARELFPGRTLTRVREFKSIHSKFLVLEVDEPNGDMPRRIMMKQCHNLTPEEIYVEYRNMQAFFNSCTSETIKAPMPLVIDQAKRVIGMEFLQGSTLRRSLLKLKPTKDDSISHILDLSAIALARFHTRCLDSSDEAASLDSPFLGSNTDTKRFERAFESCNLMSKVRPFLDFAPANILILEKEEPTISLLDFPFRNSVSTPHIDLARFRFALRVIEQHPQFRFIRLKWWDADEIFERLLQKYASESNTIPNEEDRTLIDWIETEYAKMLKSIYKGVRGSVRFALEEIYMNRFIDGYIQSRRD